MTRKLLLPLLIIFISLSAFTSALQLLKNDKAHSQIVFTVNHNGVSEVSGHINDFDVIIDGFDSTSTDLNNAKLSFVGRAASLDTRIEARNNHLKSDDFFGVEKFPNITFTSTAIKPMGTDVYLVTGNLTLRDVTRPVTMYLKRMGATTSQQGSKVEGFQLTGMLKRSAFNFGPKFQAPMISDEVYIKADGEFIRP